MEDQMKTKEQLIDELNELRKIIAGMRKNGQEHILPKYEYQWGGGNY